jgi:hypothetical protein
MPRATIVKSTDCTTKTIASFVPLRLSIQPASQEFSQASGTMTFNISRFFYVKRPIVLRKNRRVCSLTIMKTCLQLRISNRYISKKKYISHLLIKLLPPSHY